MSITMTRPQTIVEFALGQISVAPSQRFSLTYTSSSSIPFTPLRLPDTFPEMPYLLIDGVPGISHSSSFFSKSSLSISSAPSTLLLTPTSSCAALVKKRSNTAPQSRQNRKLCACPNCAAKHAAGWRRLGRDGVLVKVGVSDVSASLKGSRLPAQ